MWLNLRLERMLKLRLTQISIIILWCSSATAEVFTPLEAGRSSATVESPSETRPLTGFIYNDHGKKDPFTPPVVKAIEKQDTDALAGVRLEGIIWDEKNPIAVVNDKVVGIGDVISGAKIIEIKENEVIFDVNGQRISVKLIIKEE